MVSVGGLASGIDTQSVISQLTELERRPIAKMQRDIAELQQFQAAFSGLGSRFAELNAVSTQLSMDNLTTPSVSVSDTTKATVTATGGAIEGNHSLVVTQLADAHRIGSQGFSDADTAISGVAGTFTVQVGAAGAQTSISITTSTTMNDLANSINAADGDVSASVVNDGTTDNSYRLVLTSRNPGLDNTIQISSNTTNLDFTNTTIESSSDGPNNAGTYTGTVTSSGTYTGTASKTFRMEILTAGAVGVATYRVSEDGGATWDNNGGGGYTTATAAGTLGGNTEGVNIAFSNSGTLTAGDVFTVDVTHPTLNTGQDAVFTLDGITQSRSSNAVSDALEGVTVNLVATTASAITFEVSQSDYDVVEAVEACVSAYNSLFTAISSQHNFDADTQEAGLLLGDRTANTVLRTLRSPLTETITGLSGTVSSLIELGISSSSEDGTLSLNSSTLNSLLSSDRETVIGILASDETSTLSTLSVGTRPDGAEDGTYDVAITTAAEKAVAAPAGGAQSDLLGAAETITFTYSANYTEASPTITSFTVALATGDSLSQVVNKMNSTFSTQGVNMRAYNNGGTLAVETTAYGEDMRFTMVSDTATGANTSRIGTTTITDQGVNIAGTINGQAATGTGERLEVNDGNDLEDLAILYTGATTGTVGSVTLTTGIGTRFTDAVAQLNSGSESVLGTRQSSIQDQIDAIEESIANKEDQVAQVQARLEAQFASLEVTLAALQSQGDFLTNQLASLAGTKKNS